MHTISNLFKTIYEENYFHFCKEKSLIFEYFEDRRNLVIQPEFALLVLFYYIYAQSNNHDMNKDDVMIFNPDPKDKLNAEAMSMKAGYCG